jgi:RHS repeat-associated protein/uncharacterized repeat protein (TIGR01451 family)
MRAQFLSSRQGLPVSFRRDSLIYRMTSLLLVWAIIMGSMPAYAPAETRGEWVSSWKFETAPPTTAKTPLQGKTGSARVLAARGSAPARPYAVAKRHALPTTAALQPPSLPAMERSTNPLLSSSLGSLFALPLQTTGDSQLQVSVGFADNNSASANFPEPWNEANPRINFVGGGTVYRAGAIRLDNPGSSPITADKVKVDLGRPGPVFQLWQNVTVPAGGSAILTQTQNGNFNTSASPIIGCGLSLASNETRIPKITVTIAGTSAEYLDAAHVLDTGGFDSSCRGNQSLEWRPVGTTGMESPGGSIQLVSDGAPHAVGTQDTLTVQINDAGNQPLANSPVKLNVLNGPNAGKSFTGVTDGTGVATIQYSGSTQGSDQIQAVAANVSGGSLLSQQAATVWTSADACVAPASPRISASRLIYIGQNSISFGDTMRLAVLLTDGTGNPLGGRSVSFSFAGQNQSATTDGNGVARMSASTLPAGQSAVSISFAGDASYQAAQVSASASVLPAPTLLRYTGSNLVTALGQQQVSAVLTNSLGTMPVAGRAVTFTLNGVNALGTTDASGSATATLNFATALTTGSGQLQINFGGDSNYRPSSRTASVQIYQPMPFVIWGGNTGGLRIGQRVNFWGSQWESQVINGQYFAANPSFKGWSGALTGPIQQCLPNVTQATLTSACWDVKPGQSFPPDQVLPSLIEVIVSTVVDKSGSDVFGNIACGAVLTVDHTPPYGAVPAQPGFGTITAVSGDCAGVFPAPAVLNASQQQTSLVLPNQGVPINYSIRNTGATNATGVTLNENFDQVTPATGTANLGNIATGATTTGNFQVTIPGISPRQGAESSVDYQSRLAVQDGRLFTSQAEITFSDIFAQIYAPVDFSSFSQLTLPRLSVGISGSSCVAPSSTIPYQVLVANDGSAIASHIASALHLPDGTTANPAVPDLAAGTKFVATANWLSPGIGGKSLTESTQDYLARLQTADGVTLPAAVFSSTWQDALGNGYGPVEQPFIALTQRIPIVSTTVPATQSLLPNQATQFGFNVSNIGTGNAVQVTLKLKRQDGTFVTVPNFSLPGGQNASLSANYRAPAISAKGVAEADAAYVARLQSINNSTLNLSAVLNWTDPAQNSYGPTENAFAVKEILPVIGITLSGPATAQAGDSISYTLTAVNSGAATARAVSLALTLPNGTVQPFAAGPLAPNGQFQTIVNYSLSAGQPAGTISAQLSASWTDAAQNAYGTLSATATTAVTSTNTLTLAPAIAGPDVTGSSQTMTATVVSITGAPVSGATVQFNVTGANSASGSTITDSTGTATFTYTGTHSGVDTVIANTGAASSNTASITWLVPSRNISTSTIVGRFFSGDNSCFFDVSRTTPPAFSQEFPTINFTPPSTLTPGNTSNVTPLTRPFTDITTDVNGNFTGTIQAQGNGLQAGLGTMASFNAVFTGSFVVSKAGNVTFNFLAQDGYVFGISGGAMRVSGPLVNSPASGLTPFESFSVLSAFDGPAVQTDKTTVINFPAPGTYPFELDYSECQDAGLQLVMTAGQAGIPSTGSLALSPVNPPPQPTGQTQKFTVKATDAAGAPVVNQSVTLIVAGANPQPLVAVTDAAGIATFSYIGNNAGTDTLQAVANISGLGTYSNVVNASWVASNGSKLFVSAGPNQNVTLPSNTNTLPLVPTLVPISTGFNSAVGADYHQPTNQVVVSVNYSSGLPHNFELVSANGTHTQFSNIKGLTDEVYIAAARDEGGGRSIGGFRAGEMFTGSGVGGVIVRISPDGTQILNPWVTLPGEGGLLRGQLYIDRTGIFGGDLIVATTTGNIWRVSSAGAASRLANVGVPPEGLITVPADPLRYGPWAGKIVTGSEDAARIFAIDTAGLVTFFDLGIAPEHIKLATPNENYFGVDFSSQTLWGIPAPELSSMTGDLLIGEEFPGNLWQVHWNGSSFETTRIAQVAQWEGATMAPAGISQVTSVTSITVPLNGIVSETPLPAGTTLTSAWSQVQGPGIATFSSPNTPVTTVSFSAPGTYVLRLTGSDSLLTATSDVTVSILGNQSPVTNAGKDQQANFPSTVSLHGTASDDGLPVNSSLSTFWIKVNGPGNVAFTAPTYDASAQFSATANPNSPWTYGSTPKRGGLFTAYPFPGQQSGMPTWFLTAPTSGTTVPLLSFNNTGAPVVTTATVPPNTLLLHPGAAGENSVIRWTAPTNGTYLVQGRFFALTSTTTDVAVLLNSSTTLLSGNVNGTGSGTSGVPFTLVRTLNAGDNVDFTVGFGTNNNNANDSTGLTVTVTQAGDPATTASFRMPGDYELRLIGYDGELFGFSDTHVRVVPPCLAPLSGLVGWWPGDGDARDLANANTGVLEGGVTFNPGKVGQAFHLNGTTADVVAPASAALNASSLTLDAWVFPLDSGTGRPMLEYSSSTGTIGVHLWENFNSAVQVTPGAVFANVVDSAGGSHILATGAGALQFKQWNHVALTYDRTTGIGRIYVNGAAIAVASLGVFTPRTALPFYIGARPGNAHFLGDIDEPQVYNRALTPAEILSIYTADASGNCKPNGPQPPVVSAGLDQAVFLPNTQVTLNGSAIDPAGGPLAISWSVVSGAGPVVFGNPSAAVTTATFTEPGVYVLRLTASNAQQTASSDVNISLSQVINQAPVVSAGANQSVELPITTVTLTGSVTDDGLPLGGTITQQWSKLSGPGTVTFSSPTQLATQATFSSPGTYLLQLTASDSQLSASSVVSVAILQKFVGGPVSGTIVQGQVPITLAPGITLASGVLDYWPASNPNNVQVINPNTTGSGTIGIFDGTLLANGSYVVRLTATDTNGNAQVSLITLTVVGENKPGRVTTTVTDLQVPVGGIPISIVRAYDSLQQGQIRDFGFGWGLSIGIDLEVDPSYNVTFTLNGQRKTFFFQPQASSFLFPWLLLPTYSPEAGLHGTLTSDGCGGLLHLQSSVVCFPSGAYQPTTYTYTDASGTRYVIGSDGSLHSVQDINGNTLTVTAAGITGSKGINVPFQRDPQGRITQITDPQGHLYQYSYDSSGNLVTVQYPGISSPITYTYDSSHRLTGGIDANNHALPSRIYDTSGRLQSVTDALGNTTTYSYTTATVNGVFISTTTITLPPDANGISGTVTNVFDSFGSLLSSTDPLGHTTTNTYDANHNLISTTDPVRHTSTYTYDSRGNRTSVTFPRTASSVSTTITTAYNQFSQPVSLTDQLGNVRTVTYDANLLPQTITDTVDGSTAVLRSFHYNPDGTKQAEAAGFNIAASPNKATTYTYDANGNLASSTDPLGRVTAYTYDNLGLLRSVTDPLPSDADTTVSTTTTYKYDDFGRLIEIDAPLGRTAKFGYDNNGNKTSETDSRGNTTAFKYDALNRLVLTTYPTTPATTVRNAYDFRGKLIDSTDEAGHVTHNVYDLAGRLLSITLAFGTPDASTVSYTYFDDGRKKTETDARGNITTYAYDAAGRLTSVTDALGHQTTNVYDDANRLISTTDPNGHTTKYSYDTRGRRRIVTYPDSTTKVAAYDAANNITGITDQAGAKVQYAYDDANQFVSVVQANHPDSVHNTTRYDYDNLGDLAAWTDANGHQNRQTFNVFGELTAQALPNGGTSQTSGYDPAGNVLSVTDFKGKITTYSYDALNRLTGETPDPALSDSPVTFAYTPTSQISSMTDAGGTTTYTYDSQDRVLSKSTPAGTLTYTYDAAGNLASMASSNANGVSISYTYDKLNRLSTITDNRLPQGAGTTVYGYDPVSNLATVTLPNGVQSTFSYDGLNRLTSLQAASGTGQTIASFGYQLDAAGNQTSVNELGGRSVQWNYDGIYRLTGETVTGDPIGKNGTVAYGLDPVGNRLSTISSLFDISSGVFSFNANDFLNSENYDANGNVIIAAGAAFNYDFQNRLVNVTDIAGNAQIQLAYDALGNRVSKTVGGITTQYLVDDQNPTGLPQVVEEVVNGVVQKGYTYGYLLLAQDQLVNGVPTPHFYGYDGGLNVRFLTDASGAISDTYDYDAYGNLINKTGSTTNNYLYRGEQFDSDLGLYYLRARYYNPATGRFLGRDPAPGDVTAPETFHKYSYAGNNPANFVDPTGLEAEEEASLLTRISVQAIPAIEIGLRVACILNGISDAFAVFELFQSKEYVDAGIGLAYLAVNLYTCKAEFKTGKRPPNPFGSAGKLDHQAKVAELEAKARGELQPGESIELNKKVKGFDSNRRPDVQILDNTGKTRKIFEAERRPGSARNQNREAEYDRLGIPHETHPLK